MGKQMTFEQAESFFEWLQGKTPSGCGVTVPEQPGLSPAAFGAIYYLQDLGLIPDTYEICGKCGCLFDSEDGGELLHEGERPDLEKEGWAVGWYCDACSPFGAEAPAGENGLEEPCPHCGHINEVEWDGTSRTTICESCGKRILLCSLCDWDLENCSKGCPHRGELAKAEKVRIKVNEILRWFPNGFRDEVVQTHVLEGDSLTECFRRAYALERGARYDNARRYELADPELHKKYLEWKLHGVIIELYYGNATVD